MMIAIHSQLVTKIVILFMVKLFQEDIFLFW